jgi:hypothetical protein
VKALGFLLLMARLVVCVLCVLQLGSKEGGQHAASVVKAAGVRADHVSHQGNLFETSAHVGQIETPWHGSVPALERGVSSVPGNALQGMCGSNPHRAPGLCGLSPDASPFNSVRRRCEVVAFRAVVLGSSTNHVTSGESAAPIQPGNASSAAGVREGRNTSPLNAGGPRRDRGESPYFDQAICASTRWRNLDGVLQVATANSTRKGTVASGDSIGGKPLARFSEGWSPSRSATPKPGIAQQQESATRLASVALRVTGSAAARPDSFGGAA